MNRSLASLLIGALAMLGAGASHAVSASGPNVSTDASGIDFLSFDLDVTGGSLITVDVSLDGDSGPLTFNSVVFNFAPQAFSSFAIELIGGAEFSVLGDVTDGFGTFFPNVSGGATAALINFSPDAALTFAGFEIGDPLGLTGALDWGIDVSGVTGGNFQIVLIPAFVPEPATALLLGFGVAALATRRRVSIG